MITLNVLAVDDEAGMRSGIQRSLATFEVEVPEAQETIQFLVEEASTGEEAVSRIMESAPDILLLDYKLPGISGIDVLNQTVEQQDEMLTIMITAYAGDDGVQRAVDAGTWKVLRKPVDIQQLLGMISEATSAL